MTTDDALTGAGAREVSTGVPVTGADLVEHVEVRSGAYHDSVTLMQASRAVAGLAGIEGALIAMGTELNLDILRGMGFAMPSAGPNDLVVAVRAVDEAALTRGLDGLDAALSRPTATRSVGGASGADVPPRTTGSALRRISASLALVSVPGRFAFAEAMDALEGGVSVLVFSDNVPVEQEVRLKQEAARRGLLVMGPDCGTAVVGGVGLGFANAVRPGPVGLVAASGTGAQQLLCLLDAAGVGVSACLGVGGRDLSAAVGGRSTLQAMAALDADPATELVVVVSKPPAKEVADAVAERAAAMRTPTLLALLGRGQPDLTTVAARAIATTGAAVPQWPEWPPSGRQPSPCPRSGALRGLFSGGTLCDEAMVIAAAELGPVASNIPLEPDWALPDDLRTTGHAMIDFGDDRLTAGRPHPMIDPSLRLERLAVEAGDPGTAVVLLDVVLGHGSHPDPAADLAPAIRAAREARRRGSPPGELAVVVSLCGTSSDPQRRDRQAEALAAAGAHVFASNAAAARHAVGLVRPASATGNPADRSAGSTS